MRFFNIPGSTHAHNARAQAFKNVLKKRTHNVYSSMFMCIRTQLARMYTRPHTHLQLNTLTHIRACTQNPMHRQMHAHSCACAQANTYNTQALCLWNLIQRIIFVDLLRYIQCTHLALSPYSSRPVIAWFQLLSYLVKSKHFSFGAVLTWFKWIIVTCFWPFYAN